MEENTMIIGLPKEIKNNEFRVGLTPNNVSDYIHAGHTVLVEQGAGVGSGYTDQEYVQAGAVIVETAAQAWNADMIVKVKEPVTSEYGYFREGMILYTYLHLADNEPLTRALMEKKVKSVAYETIVGPRGGLPCLAPMSHIAGRLAMQEGAKYLEKPYGGRGVLLSGVPGVQKGNVVILGGGNVGINACKMAVGMGANVTVLDINLERLGYLDDVFGNFKYIKCIESEEVDAPEKVEIEVDEDNNASVIWPSTDGVNSYELVISKDGEVFCTLTFNKDGQLLNIAFAPSRDGQDRAQYAELTTKGLRFTVTGLESGTNYDYTITTKDSSDHTISTYSGEFTTQSDVTTSVSDSQSPMANCQKIFRNGQLIILRDGVEYNTLGAKIQ
jgi:hypothetical protein